MKQPTYPAGWDEDRVRRVLEQHYEPQSDEEALPGDEAAYRVCAPSPDEFEPDWRTRRTP